MSSATSAQDPHEGTPLMKSKKPKKQVRMSPGVKAEIPHEGTSLTKADTSAKYSKYFSRQSTPDQVWSKYKKEMIAASVGLCLVLMGVVFGYVVQDWHLLTSIYVMTQIVTTIGYGDFTVTAPQTKVVISFYLMAMMVLFSYYLNLFAQKLSAVEHKVAMNNFRRLQSGHHLASMSNETIQVITYGFCFIISVLFGTIFYAHYEECTCSYGRSLIEGCKDTSIEVCKDTGGYVKSYHESFYMSVVTLLTIGFGDHTPRSYFGRLVGVVWMIVGVAITANFVGSISEYFFASQAHVNFESSVDMGEETFKRIDTDGNGALNRAEFLNFALETYNLVPRDVIAELNGLFDRLDSIDPHHPGSVRFEKIEALHRWREKHHEGQQAAEHRGIEKHHDDQQAAEPLVSEAA